MESSSNDHPSAEKDAPMDLCLTRIQKACSDTNSLQVKDVERPCCCIKSSQSIPIVKNSASSQQVSIHQLSKQSRDSSLQNTTQKVSRKRWIFRIFGYGPDRSDKDLKVLRILKILRIFRLVRILCPTNRAYI